MTKQLTHPEWVRRLNLFGDIVGDPSLEAAPTEEILEATDVDLSFNLTGSAGDPIDGVGMLGVQRATLYRLNMSAPLSVSLLPSGGAHAGYLLAVRQLRYGTPAP